jgi:hypothetical protein
MALSGWSTSNYVTVSAAAITDYPFTMGCWFNSTSATAGQNLIAFNRTADNISAVLSVEGDVAGDPISAYINTTGSDAVKASTSTGYSINTWHHACGVYSSATLRTAYIDGGSSGTNTTSRAVGAWQRTSIGVYFTGSRFSPILGQVAEVGIWNAALTAEEVASLARGVSPALIRPASLIHHLPLLRGNQDVRGTAWTTAGTLTASAHPRIYAPQALFTRPVITPAIVSNGSYYRYLLGQHR